MGDALLKIGGNVSMAEVLEIWKQNIALLYGRTVEILQENRFTLGEKVITSRFWQLEGKPFRGERSADVPTHVKSSAAEEVLANHIVAPADRGDQFL